MITRKITLLAVDLREWMILGAWRCWCPELRQIPLGMERRDGPGRHVSSGMKELGSRTVVEESEMPPLS